MGNALDPRERKQEIEEQIAVLRRKISNANDNYESLNRFKSSVENSQGAFNTINGRAVRFLEPLASITQNNKIADKYMQGISSSLSSIGMSVVGASFSALLGMISLEKGRYYSISLQYEREMNLLSAALREVEAEIALLSQTGG